jgi:DNA-3-methyladenine glycosylase I
VKTYGSLGAFIWRYEPPVVKTTNAIRMTVTQTEHSAKLAKDLKKLGWRFFGPTTAYAFMQAMGLVNDHAEGCIIREECEVARANFRRPKALSQG